MCPLKTKTIFMLRLHVAWADFEKSGKLSTGLIVKTWLQLNKLSCQLDVKISDSDLDLKSQKMIALKIDLSEL